MSAKTGCNSPILRRELMTQTVTQRLCRCIPSVSSCERFSSDADFAGPLRDDLFNLAERLPAMRGEIRDPGDNPR